MKEKEETLAQKALRLLKDVPKEEWTTGKFTNGKSKCCAIGHFQRLTSKDPKDYSIGNCFGSFSPLIDCTEKFIDENASINWSNGIISINDGEEIKFLIDSKKLKTNSKYKKLSPKKRVILFLEWMVKEGW